MNIQWLTRAYDEAEELLPRDRVHLLHQHALEVPRLGRQQHKHGATSTTALLVALDALVMHRKNGSEGAGTGQILKKRR
jgi:hypothetical protein